MTDREKVIKAIEICCTGGKKCTECPYNSKEDCDNELMQDALALLREQKTEAPRLAYCPNCGAAVEVRDA